MARVTVFYRMRLAVLLGLASALVACAAPSGGQQGAPVVAPEPPAERRTQPVGQPQEISRVKPGPTASSLLARAEYALARNELEQAELWVERAQRMSPQAGEVYLLLARLRAGQGDWSAAEQFCRRALSLSGTDENFRAEAQALLEQVQRRQV